MDPYGRRHFRANAESLSGWKDTFLGAEAGKEVTPIRCNVLKDKTVFFLS